MANKNENKVDKVKKVKKVKLSGEPVKNKSSYMFFCCEERKKIVVENPGLINKEIIIEIAKRWCAVKENPEEFEKYKIMAKNDKDRFLKEKEEFKNPESNLKVDDDNTVTKNTSSNKTKKSSENNVTTEKKTKVNGYINYCKKNRDQVKKDNPGLLPKDVTRELGNLWKALSNEEKEVYTKSNN